MYDEEEFEGVEAVKKAPVPEKPKVEEKKEGGGKAKGGSLSPRASLCPNLTCVLMRPLFQPPACRGRGRSCMSSTQVSLPSFSVTRAADLRRCGMLMLVLTCGTAVRVWPTRIFPGMLVLTSDVVVPEIGALVFLAIYGLNYLYGRSHPPPPAPRNQRRKSALPIQFVPELPGPAFDFAVRFWARRR
eukprot:2853806-Rhodomonas_salina.1